MQLAARFKRDRRGLAAVEFALFLPFMLLLYICSAAITQGVSASRDVTVLARTLTDLVSQQPANVALTDTTAQDIFNASTAVMSPFSTTSLKMTLSNVEFVADAASAATNQLDAKTRWTVTFSGGTLRPCLVNPRLTAGSNTASPTPSTIPIGLYVSGFLIVADVSYVYTPAFGYFTYDFGTNKAGTTVLSMTMSRTSYMRPRQTDNIRYQASQSAQICPIASPQTA